MLLDDVAAFLEAQGLGNVKTTGSPATGWWIYKGTLVPSNQDSVIALIEGPGEQPLDEMGSTISAVVAENPGLVVQVRHSDYEPARAKAHALWVALHRKSGVLGATRYLGIEARQSPFLFGRDDASRYLIGCNYSVMKEVG